MLQLRLLAPVFAAFLAAVAWAENPSTRTTQPADDAGEINGLIGPAATGPASRPTVHVSPEARQLLDQVRDAYDKLKSLELAGAMSFEQDIAGEKATDKASFTAAYQAPNKFRHELKADGDNLLIGSTGAKLFVFIKARNSFYQTDAPRERIANHDLPRYVRLLLSNQNPSLALAVSNDASAELLEDAKSIEKVADTKIGDDACPTLRLVANEEASGQTVIVAFDPKTHLIRRFQVDMKAVAESQGAPEVKLAMLTLDYTTAAPDAPAKDEQFAWAPPPGAKDLLLGATAEEEPAVALTGQAAPDFTLKDLNDKDVKLSDLKGSVVVLDFWATSCVGCRVSLPQLDKTAKAYAAKGLKVLAINEIEDKDKALAFVRSIKVSLPVLLDIDGSVGTKYMIEPLPATVVIGKDGIIKKVLVGYTPLSEEQLKLAIEAALK